MDSEHGPKPSEGYYWCTFADKEQTRIAGLSSFRNNMPDHAVQLPASDLRVQHVINPPEGRAIQRIVVSDLDDLVRLSRLFENGIPKPIYRGQSDYGWHLQTRIERNAPEFVVSETGLETYEYRVLTEAQRRWHHYIEKLPELEDVLSWLALLSHQGVPTRLLDVTRSLYVALYFALRHCPVDQDAALWIFSRDAIGNRFLDWSTGANESWLRLSPFTPSQYGEPYYGPYPRNRNGLGMAPTIDSLRSRDMPRFLDYWGTLEAALQGYIDTPGVAAVEPFWLSRRIDCQQGAFLVPFNIRVPFEANLTSYLQLDLGETEEKKLADIDDRELHRLWMWASVYKVRLPATIHHLVRNWLDSMNVRDLTLFPDTDGAIAHLSALVPVKGK